MLVISDIRPWKRVLSVTSGEWVVGLGEQLFSSTQAIGLSRNPVLF